MKVVITIALWACVALYAVYLSTIPAGIPAGGRAIGFLLVEGCAVAGTVFVWQ